MRSPGISYTDLSNREKNITEVYRNMNQQIFDLVAHEIVTTASEFSIPYFDITINNYCNHWTNLSQILPAQIKVPVICILKHIQPYEAI